MRPALRGNGEPLSTASRPRRVGGLAGLAALLALVGGASPALAADIFRCPSDNNFHFTNVPMRAGCVRVMGAPPEAVAPPALRVDPTLAARRAGALAAFETLILQAAARHRLDPALIKAVIRAESNFDHRAVSRKGALGLMQLMPATAGMYGLADAFEPRGNIEAGSRHLRTLLDRYSGDLHLALAAYNAGEQAVERYGRRIPPFAETRGYVRSVLRHLDTYRRTPTLTARTPSLTAQR